MTPTNCPYCRETVTLAPPGPCPHCGRTIASPAAPATAEKSCPGCGAALAPNVVLCVACGYHLKLERFLATAANSSPIATAPNTSLPPAATNSNPYAPPGRADSRKSGQQAEQSNVPSGVWEEVEAIVADAKNVVPLIIVGFFCVCVWLLSVPYYCYRCHRWNELYARYPELRTPNSFSEHGELVANFQDAPSKLRLGIGFGIIQGLIAIGVAIYQIRSQP